MIFLLFFWTWPLTEERECFGIAHPGHKEDSTSEQKHDTHGQEYAASGRKYTAYGHEYAAYGHKYVIHESNFCVQGKLF